MKEKLQQIREKAIAEIEGSDGLDRLNEVRQAVLGKKGELTAVLKGMKDVAPEDRPKVGQWVNDTRTAMAEKDGTKVEVPVGRDYLIINGKRADIDTTAQLYYHNSV